MSDEEDDLIFFGTPLEPYDEDAFPKRKPISVEDQIATDSHGRRRFHGAFTGGFSAGFYNTVGSLEGWTPSEFKSTRSEKANKMVQKPEDFMDDEDVGEYGIAPQTIKATKEYSTVKKRSRQIFTDGPIPGIPVLDTLITSGNETVGYLLLRNMGIEDKIKKREEELNPGSKVYGCEIPTKYQISENIQAREYKIPDTYKEYLKNPKSNTAGLGYKGLDKPHVNLFHSTNLVVKEKNDKNFTIKGQAFGIGAFEEEDDDIYMKEDMSNYDFELTKEKEKPTTIKESITKDLVLGMFEKSSKPLVPKKQYCPPTIPHWFTGVHKVRKSRFEPVKEENTDPVPRSQINPAIRAKYLGEEVNESHTPSKEVENIKKENEKVKDTPNDENKNKKFDFSSVLSDKFVSASKKEDVNNILEEVQKSETTHGTQQMRDAAKMKMFGPLTRISTDWHPSSLLCKRFNVPEPFTDQSNNQKKKRTKNLIFQTQKHQEDIPDLKPGISRTSDEPVTVEEVIKIEPHEDPNTSTIQVEDTSITEDTIETKEISNVAPVNEQSPEVPPVDFTEKIGIEDKLDLYKAVFLSSSESEDETETQNTESINHEDKIEEFKSTILSEPLLPQIKPIKEGILSGIDFRDFNRNRKKIQINEEEDETHDFLEIQPPVNPLLYGPQIPLGIGDSRNVNNVSQNIVVSSDSEDEWVEKDATEKKKKSKHKKKDKRHKHKKHKKNGRR